ncbi:kynurenine formamidase-like [Gigantopelta aegis]|uniref:kynurenine formamidase-like n=1 Tax=Gigantopelta aegis TaxID=1735272 RepID=UPI001B88D600|nr:kynurenine formamidase-like [Gigantopelta aegis]
MAIPPKELDYHYSPSRWSHRMGSDEVIEAHINTVTQASREATWLLNCDGEISYGSGPLQKLDIFTAKNAQIKGVPIFVFIHGGYWHMMGRAKSSFLAPPLAKAGSTVVIVGYDLAPAVTMDKIVSEIKQAIRFVLKLAKERQSSGVYLCGHSAGAHLAAVMLACEFSDDDAFDSEIIKGAFLVSGVYDLRPLVQTTVNEPLKMTENDAWRLSPFSFVGEIAAQSRQRDILFAVAEYDSPEFRRQSAEMEKELRSRGVKTRFIDVPDTDHFDVIEKLKKEDYSLTKEMIRLMHLSK